ncbi:bifunctional tetrahydrofolate synthase/dihydrofolate synthase [Pigmentiphaga sp.]|uniref:bifunctional tetrahydrofolate synthase/dihydrofolate synthase n=1 Tax=Pigmentiphaga sp. TaxID=1977564 RepID=UPI0025F8D9A2|nr:bifunctional tetrahydrofolate synthase/dihydrofolate synthase [Pigmentiphaga sp.]MBX6318351.1 bifunctional tetrahydrofolate synthase/dihydrofolate synthase [Pigmentiphaga sp.]
MSSPSPVSRPNAQSSLAQWLAYLESIHARPIDMGLERVRAVADRLGQKLDAVTIVVGGTNGKGSTCAMLEAMLLAAGYRVGLYTSPHLLDFNERARINGEPASDAALAEQFAAVDEARGEVSLTYFELTTLAILRLFAGAGLDAVILEVGLGGRLDAVNVVDADCAIVTSVDLDHVEWLGDDREKIGWEKAHIYRPGKPAICADPVPPQSLIDYAESIGADLWRFGRDYNYAGDKQQWSYGGRAQRRNALAYPALRGANQLLNASAALAALEALRDRLPVPQQAVRLGLLQVQLPGRFQILPGRPTVILDVAHNPHAAAVLAQNLDNMGFFPYTYAVFGMLGDKDVDGVIAKLGGRVDHWLCAGLPGPRGLGGEELAARLRALGVKEDKESSIQVHADPAAAFAAAQERAGEGDRILVFGSFLTVAGVLASMRTAKAAHAG